MIKHILNLIIINKKPFSYFNSYKKFLYNRTTFWILALQHKIQNNTYLAFARHGFLTIGVLSFNENPWDLAYPVVIPTHTYGQQGLVLAWLLLLRHVK